MRTWTRRSTVTLVTCGVALIVTAFAPHAAAQPAADRRAAAQVLFEQAKTLVEAERFAEACPKLAESMRLDPGIGTGLWLADCYENNGQTASAWVQFKETAATAALQKDPREKIAQERAAKLEDKLSRMQIVMSKEAQLQVLEIKRDGSIVGGAELNIPVPLDPGIHAITASAPGKKPWSTTVTVPRQPGVVTVTIPALEAADPVAPSPVFSKGTEAEHHEPSSTGSTQRVFGLATLGLGVAGVGVGTFFAFEAKSTYDDSNQDGKCVDNRCDATGKGLRSDASSQAMIATIAMGAGAAAILGGAILYFTAPQANTTRAVIPALDPHGASLSLCGRF